MVAAIVNDDIKDVQESKERRPQSNDYFTFDFDSMTEAQKAAEIANKRKLPHQVSDSVQQGG